MTSMCTERSISDGMYGQKCVEERSKVFCDALRFMTTRTKVYFVDVANERLRSVSPLMQTHGYGYEVRHLANRMGNVRSKMEKGEVWLRDAFATFMEKCMFSVDAFLSGNAEAHDALYTYAILGLVTQANELTVDSCPESLMVNLENLQFMQREINFEALVMSMFTHFNGTLKKLNNVITSETLTATLSNAISNYSPVSQNSAKAVSHFLLTLRKTGMDKTDSVGYTMIANAFNRSLVTNDAISKLYQGKSGRICKHWCANIGERTIQTNENKLCPYMVHRIKKFLLRMNKIIALDLKISRMRYDYVVFGIAEAMKTAKDAAKGDSRAIDMMQM